MTAGGRTAAALGAWIVFEDEAGFAMTPPRVRTWGRRGQTPVVRVRGRSRRRISIAALCCYRSGERSRLIYRPRFHSLLKGARLKGARKSLAWQDYRDLLVRAHLQLGAPIVVVWDNSNTHRAAGMRKYAADHDWLTIVRLPSYSPDLNPVEGVWSLLPLGWTANTPDPAARPPTRRRIGHPARPLNDRGATTGEQRPGSNVGGTFRLTDPAARGGDGRPRRGLRGRRAARALLGRRADPAALSPSA